MGINFPSSPTPGQTITLSNAYGTGPVLRYTAGAWRRSTGTALQSNRFVNPAFQVNDQNGLTDGTNVDTLVMAEQYGMRLTTAGSLRGQRLALPTPRGGSYRLRFTTTVADPGGVTGSNWLALQGATEGNRFADFYYGTSGAIFSVLRFGVNAPAGTYVFSLRNSATTRSFLCPFTVPAARANVDTEFSFSIPPCVDGVWNTGTTMWGWITWAVDNTAMYTGSTSNWLAGNYAGHNTMTNNFMSVAGKVFEFFDFGLYPDPLATGIAPEFLVPKVEDDIQECLRYWFKAKGLRGVTTSATGGTVVMTNPVQMRVNPAVSLVGTVRLYDASTAPNMTSVSLGNSNNQFLTLNPSASAGALIVGRPLQLLVDANDTAYVAANARL